MRRDTSIGIGLLAFTGVALFLTSRLPDSTMPGEPGPRFFPYVLLIVLALLSIILVSGGGGGKKHSRPKNESMRLEANLSSLEAMAFYGVFLLGLCGMSVFGFIPSMIVAVTVMLVMGGWKFFPKALGFSTILTVFVYLLFDRIMEIALPAGILFPS